MDRLGVANAARRLLGLPVSNSLQLPAEAMAGIPKVGKLELTAPLPRFRTLTVCIRAALRGVRDPSVQHMVERNRSLDEMKQIEQIMARTARA